MKKNHTTPQKNNIVSYNDFGETFGKSRLNLHWPEIDDLLLDFLRDFRPTTGNLADIGCGNGRLLSHITTHHQMDLYQKISTTYVGLDTSNVLLDQARSNTHFFDIFTSINWREGDMRGMDRELSEYGLFDAIFFIASFHHLSSQEERLGVLVEAKNLLSQTGKIVMMNWNLLHTEQKKYRDSQIAQYDNGSADYSIKIGAHERFYHAFSPQEYHSLCQQAGLNILQEEFTEKNSMLILQ